MRIRPIEGSGAKLRSPDVREAPTVLQNSQTRAAAHIAKPKLDVTPGHLRRKYQLSNGSLVNRTKNDWYRGP
jgi:hypothetical protein